MSLTGMEKSRFPTGGGWGGGREFCFGYVEFILLDMLVETLGRLLDRWICSSGSLCLRPWAECCGEGRIKPSSSTLASVQGITGKEVGGSVEGQRIK